MNVLIFMNSHVQKCDKRLTKRHFFLPFFVPRHTLQNKKFAFHLFSNTKYIFEASDFQKLLRHDRYQENIRHQLIDGGKKRKNLLTLKNT